MKAARVKEQDGDNIGQCSAFRRMPKQLVSEIKFLEVIPRTSGCCHFNGLKTKDVSDVLQDLDRVGSGFRFHI